MRTKIVRLATLHALRGKQALEGLRAHTLDILASASTHWSDAKEETLTFVIRIRESASSIAASSIVVFPEVEVQESVEGTPCGLI